MSVLEAAYHEVAITNSRLREERDKLRATLDAATRILSDDRLPLESRVNDARAVLSR